MWNPINRTTVQTEENKYRIYPKEGPLFYKKSDADYSSFFRNYIDGENSVITIKDAKQVLKGVVQLGTKVACLEEMVGLQTKTQKASREVVLLISAVTGNLLQLTDREVNEVLGSVKAQVRRAVKATDNHLGRAAK